MRFTVNVILFVGGILSSLTNATVLAPPAGWPVFTYQGVLTDNLTYNPTGEYVPSFHPHFKIQSSAILQTLPVSNELPKDTSSPPSSKPVST